MYMMSDKHYSVLREMYSPQQYRNSIYISPIVIGIFLHDEQHQGYITFAVCRTLITGCNVYDERDDECTECSMCNVVCVAYILLYQRTGMASLPCND